MCDAPLLDGILGGIIAALTLAAALVGIAIATNASLFGAGGSVALMVAAAVSVGVATAGLTGLFFLIDEYDTCMGNPAACVGYLSNLRAAIAALATVLGIMTAGCAAVALVAWIPWGPIAGMGVIIAALLLQIPLVPLLAVYFSDYRNCALQANAPIPTMGPLVIASYLFGFSMVVYFIWCFKKRQKLLKALKAS